MARRKLSAEINVVPYIDVMLVLLIIFMITAPLLVQGIEVDLPDVDSQTMGEPDQEVILSVNVQGQLYLTLGADTNGPLSDEELNQRVGAIMRNKPDKMILIEGDSKAPYQYVARAMSMLQQAGAKKIGFVTKPVEQQAAKAPSAK